MSDEIVKQPLNFVSAQTVLDVLDWQPVIESLTKAYSIPHGPSVSPLRTVARDGRVWIRTLTSVPPGARFMGAKVFGVGRKPAINYLISLIEQASGELRALVDGANITTFRTASTSAAAMQVLAPRENVILGVIGSGQEAKAHVQALSAIRTIKQLYVFSPTPASRERFAKEIGADLGIECIAVETAEKAARPASVVIAAARSRDETPTVYGEWLDNCRAMISIGSTLPEQREIDVSVIERADLIICDVLEEVIDDTGDMIAAAKSGIAFEHKCFSLNDLLTGKLDDRLKTSKFPIFKSVGAGIQDIVVAELAYTLASDAGKLIDLPIEFYTKS